MEGRRDAVVGVEGWCKVHILEAATHTHTHKHTHIHYAAFTGGMMGLSTAHTLDLPTEKHTHTHTHRPTLGTYTLLKG